jgi:hypothetical protein
MFERPIGSQSVQPFTVVPHPDGRSKPVGSQKPVGKSKSKDKGGKTPQIAPVSAKAEPEVVEEVFARPPPEKVVKPKKEWKEFPHSKHFITTSKLWNFQFQLYITNVEAFGNAASSIEPWKTLGGWWSVGAGYGSDAIPNVIGQDVRYIDPRNSDDGFYTLPVTSMSCIMFNSCLRVTYAKFLVFVKRWLNLVGTDILIVQDVAGKDLDLWTPAEFNIREVSQSFIETYVDSSNGRFYVCLIRPDCKAVPKTLTNQRSLDYVSDPPAVYANSVRSGIFDRGNVYSHFGGRNLPLRGQFMYEGSNQGFEVEAMLQQGIDLFDSMGQITHSSLI